MSEELDRCVAFMRGMEARAAEVNIRTEHGVVRLSPTLPRVWYRNFLSVDLGTEATVEQLTLEAEAIQGPAGLRHRRVTVDHDLGAVVAPGFRVLGWKVEENLVMVHRGAGQNPARNVEELEGETLAPVWAKGIAEFDADEETVRQLVAAQLSRRDSTYVRYFAARVGGDIAAYCELFSWEGVGQIESVMTLMDFRGRGLGKAVVAKAVAESKADGHALTFLVADAEDWPKEMYCKLGFTEVGRIWEFTREPISERASAQP